MAKYKYAKEKYLLPGRYSISLGIFDNRTGEECVTRIGFNAKNKEMCAILNAWDKLIKPLDPESKSVSVMPVVKKDKKNKT